MLVLIIIAAVLVVIYALLRFSIRIYYSFDSAADVKARISVKYFFFTLYENPESEGYKKRREEKEQRKRKREQKKLFKESQKKAPAKISEPEPVKGEPSDLVDEINSLDEGEAEQRIKDLEAEISLQKEGLRELEESGEEKLPTKEEIKAERKRIKARIKEKKAQKKVLREQKKNEPSRLDEIKEQYEKARPYIPTALKTFRRLLENIRLYKTDIDIMLGSDDPYKAALNYGYASAAFYPALAFLCEIFSVKFKSVDLNTDFCRKRFEARASGAVYIRVSTVLAIAIKAAAKLLWIYVKKSKNVKEDKKSNEKELVKNG